MISGSVTAERKGRGVVFFIIIQSTVLQFVPLTTADRVVLHQEQTDRQWSEQVDVQVDSTGRTDGQVKRQVRLSTRTHVIMLLWCVTVQSDTKRGSGGKTGRTTDSIRFPQAPKVSTNRETHREDERNDRLAGQTGGPLRPQPFHSTSVYTLIQQFSTKTGH